MKYLDVKRFPLTLLGETVGYRYSLWLGNVRLNPLDMGLSVSASFMSTLTREGVAVETLNPIVGFISGNVFKTKQEWGVSEIESCEALAVFVKRLKARLKEYAELRENFSYWIRVLTNALKEHHATGWMESEVSDVGICWSCRFIGGFDSWSGGGEDICDADSLDSKVGSNIEKAVKTVKRNLGSKYDLSWYTGEKAWCYFQFGLANSL